MKRLFVVLFLVLCSPARADVFQCVVRGEVNLTVDTDTVSGTIGDTVVYLARYQNMIYGSIEGFTTDLRVHGRHVVGNIGGQDIYWTYRRGGKISGNQKCIYGLLP